MESSEGIVDILLAEDNPNDAELAIRVFRKNNLTQRLHHVEDGEEALEFLYRCDPAHFPKLILLDLKMPKVDGMEVLRKIKTDELRKSIPVVIMTSSKEESDIVASYASGVNAYIVKPVNYEKFQQAVAEIGAFWLTLNQIPSK